LEFEKEKIHLGGVGDLWYGEPNLKKARRGISEGEFSLLLSHQPNFVDEIRKEDGVNFVLAGHTHGTQISMFHYVPVLPRRIARWQYNVGLIETPQTRMLVSSGVGNSPPYFRFMAAPKIHLLTFKSAPRV
jgi:predicted MPP superfamily phosphohydrolase